MTDPAQASPEQMERARRIVANWYSNVRDHDYAGWVLQGHKDTTTSVQIALTAILQSDQQQAELLAQAEAMAGALEKLSPISVQMGADYADVYFADGSTHRTQAMTMNPQDWLDLEASYSAYREYQKGRSDG